MRSSTRRTAIKLEPVPRQIDRTEFQVPSWAARQSWKISGGDGETGGVVLVRSRELACAGQRTSAHENRLQRSSTTQHIGCSIVTPRLQSVLTDRDRVHCRDRQSKARGSAVGFWPIRSRERIGHCDRRLAFGPRSSCWAITLISSASRISRRRSDSESGLAVSTERSRAARCAS